MALFSSASLRASRRLTVLSAFGRAATRTRSASTSGTVSLIRRIGTTTAGTAVVVISGSVLLWPASDLVIAPHLVLAGLGAEPRNYAPIRDELSERAAGMVDKYHAHAISVATCSEGGLGKALERAARDIGRPTVYISLREVTNPHNFSFAVLEGVYASDRLGILGTLAHSMGVWWIVLFDMLVDRDPARIRAFHLSIILQHLKRALKMKKKGAALSHMRRPLIIVDYFDDMASRMDGKQPQSSDSVMLQEMLRSVMSWCVAACYDDGLADVAIVTTCDTSRNVLFSHGNGVEHACIASNFRQVLQRRWPRLV